MLEIFQRLPAAGGPWLITDLRRADSIYELDAAVAEEVENGIENEGSNLSGVSAKIAWVETSSARNMSESIVIVDQ